MLSSQEPSADIRAIFFDIGNVLVRFDAVAVAREFSGLLCGHSMRVARMVFSGRLVDSIERGEIGGRELFGVLRKDLGFRGDFESFRRIWCGQFALERGTARLLRRAARKRKVYLLSNTNRLHYEFIRETYAFARSVHGAILSYRLKMRKPEAGIYLAALRRARIEPRQALFVDDIPENVAAAAKLGINAWRYTGPEELELYLDSLGLI